MSVSKYKKNSFSFRKRYNSNDYKVIWDFKNTTEKKCIKIDKENEDIYNKLLTTAKNTQKQLLENGLTMNLEVPMPPRPTNRDRFLLWQKRNVSRPVIEQSKAVLYLKDNGYILDQHYEAYQAIELSNELKRKNGGGNTPPEKEKLANFENIYTSKDTNILRRRSMFLLNKETKNSNSSLTKPSAPLSSEVANNPFFKNDSVNNNTNINNNSLYPQI